MQIIAKVLGNNMFKTQEALACGWLLL